MNGPAKRRAVRVLSAAVRCPILSPLTRDELDVYFEAWLAERYHRDIHFEMGEAPRDRFQRTAVLTPAPDLAQVAELLRLRERRRVHKKWSTRGSSAAAAARPRRSRGSAGRSL